MNSFKVVEMDQDATPWAPRPDMTEITLSGDQARRLLGDEFAEGYSEPPPHGGHAHKASMLEALRGNSHFHTEADQPTVASLQRLLEKNQGRGAVFIFPAHWES